MQNWKKFPRVIFLTLLVIGLCAGVVVPRLEIAKAAPMQASAEVGNIVISEFRTIGLNGGNDEFIELFNRSSKTITITNWEIRKSSGCSTASSGYLVHITNPTSLVSGQRYLIGNSLGYTGTVDSSYSTSISDDGGIALFDNTNQIVDQVGMCKDTAYKEFNSSSPQYLSPLTATANQSYERKNNGCTDTDDNFVDFNLNSSSSNPQTFSDAPIACVRVTDINSVTANGTYVAGNSIPIMIKFNVIVTVTGTPTLLLETGVIDTPATYTSGSGTNTLTFTYTVATGDSAIDLDYVSSSSLLLNGGTIVGPAGDAILTLPSPGTTGSLGLNKNIVINNNVAPSVSSFKRYNPIAGTTNSDTLVFRVTFTEVVSLVDASDFIVTGTTGTITNINVISGSIYDVTISWGDLPGLNGTVGLNLSLGPTIQDSDLNNIVIAEPTPVNDETYTVDNISPTITIALATGQAPSTAVTPVNFTIVFSESIESSTFTLSDITQAGTATFITWSLANTTDPKSFTLSATGVSGNGTIIPIITAGKVQDVAGNVNSPSSSTLVTFNDNVPPTVTINQASIQADPTSTLPVNFMVVFSEPIITSIFTTADITFSGTAAIGTTVLTDSGDHKTFTLSITTVSVAGTLIPSIAANRVTDLVGNNNIASTSTDNSVTYVLPITPLPTATRTPTPIHTPTNTPTRTPIPTSTYIPAVGRPIINEFLARPGYDWNQDGKVDVFDEFIEIRNIGNADINLSGWKLDDEANQGSSPFTLPAVTLKVGQRMVFYGKQTNILLGDGGDTVRLIHPNGKIYDAYTYAIAKVEDRSVCRLIDGSGSWYEDCIPTPSLTNTREGVAPSMPDGKAFESPVCDLPDTLPADFLFAECRGYGANIWHSFYWDQFGWQGDQYLRANASKWESFVE